MQFGRVAVVSVTLALVATACGDRGPDPSNSGPDTTLFGTQLALVMSTTVTTTTDPGDPGDTTTTEPGDTTTTSEAPPVGPGPGDFGTLVAVCGPNEGGGAIPDLGDDEILGLSADTIKLSTIADPGFQGSPGLNQEIFDAGEAFAEWCNDAGGINGKRIELTLRDSRLTEIFDVGMGAAAPYRTTSGSTSEWRAA